MSKPCVNSVQMRRHTRKRNVARAEHDTCQRCKTTVLLAIAVVGRLPIVVYCPTCDDKPSFDVVVELVNEAKLE
jgi:hypothetical protein